MTRVDFYVLDDTGAAAREQFACRLVEKIFRLRHRVFVHTGSDGAARHFDSLLWRHSDSSFVPHVVDGPGLDPALAGETPVRIGTGVGPEAEAEVLVNLSDDVPLFFSQFERVAEIVPGDPEARSALRERFRFYRDRGYEIETHRIGGRGR